MHKIKRVLMSVCLAGLLAVTPVTVPFISNSNTVEAATVKLSKTSATVYTGGTLNLKISGTSSDVKWSSSSSKIAKVSDKGVVTGLKAGKATIVAAIGSKKYKCSVTVKNPYISSTALQVGLGKTSALSVKGAVGTVTWKSSDTSVATVNAKGVVTGKSLGTTKITVKDSKNTYTCKVTVVEIRMTANKTKVTCDQETSVVITVKNKQEDEVISYDVSNSNVKCELGAWAGNENTLKIIPIKKGTASITITSDKTNQKLVIPVTVSGDTRTDKDAKTAKEIYNQTSSAVVQVNTEYGLGSGFFIGKGVVVTNYHVVVAEENISVLMENGNEYKVDKILGYNKDLDIAILSVPITNNPVLEISPYNVEVGDSIYTIGSSLGLEGTFTNGIVTNASRFFEKVEYIQINAAISSGNSGGPLINAYGEVVGINTMQYVDGQNLNFAIDIEQLYSIDTTKPMSVSDFYRESFADYYANIAILEDETLSSSTSTAQELPNEFTAVGSIDTSKGNDGRDYYKFTLSAAGTVYADAMAATYNYDDSKKMAFSITDANGNVIASSTYFEDYDAWYIESYLSAGTYYLTTYSTAGSFSEPLPYVVYYELE